MMKRLGVEVETQLPDEASFQEFQTAFKLPLSSSTQEAMQVLFPSRVGLLGHSRRLGVTLIRS